MTATNLMGSSVGAGRLIPARRSTIEIESKRHRLVLGLAEVDPLRAALHSVRHSVRAPSGKPSSVVPRGLKIEILPLRLPSSPE